MLENVRIRHFRCLRDLNVPLRPLTVLIGANDTGKSSFLAALNKLADQSELAPSDYWRMDTKLEAMIAATWSEKDVSRSSETIWDQKRKPQTGGDGAAAISRMLTPCLRVQLPSDGPIVTTEGHSDTSGVPAFDPKGGNIPAFLDYLLRKDRQRLEVIEKTLRRLVPGFSSISVATPVPAKRRLDFRIESELEINGDQASTGVRLLVFFVSLAYHPEPPRLLLLEEPETGVHPKRLGEVMGLLRELTQGLHGSHATQIILTTHSPYLLDHVDLSTDQVLVFRREEDGSRTAEPVDGERLRSFLDEFMLGEVWFNQGEKELISRAAP